MRKIDKIILHFSETPSSMDIGFKEINQWHKERGFCSPSGIHCGYHYIIRRDGSVEEGRPEKEVGAHCLGQNSSSIGPCIVGGFDNGLLNLTYKQYVSIYKLVDTLEHKYQGSTVHGHNEFSSKPCPGFDVKAFFDGVL